MRAATARLPTWLLPTRVKTEGSERPQRLPVVTERQVIMPMTDASDGEVTYLMGNVAVIMRSNKWKGKKRKKRMKHRGKINKSEG